MGWGKEWPEFKQTVEQTVIYSGENMFPEINHVKLGIDLATQPDKTVYHQFKNGKYEEIVEADFKNLIGSYADVINRNNLKPTHDPYTNPNANIYYECACGAILDPGTKSFAKLNNYASENGWKIRFKAEGYVPYCVKCGERVE